MTGITRSSKEHFQLQMEGFRRRNLGSRSFHARAGVVRYHAKPFRRRPRQPVSYELFLSLLEPRIASAPTGRSGRSPRPAAISTFPSGCSAAQARTVDSRPRRPGQGRGRGPAPCQRHRSRHRRGKAARGGAENAREPPALDPRHRAGRDDRDRRLRHHAILQHRGRAAVRLHRTGGDRQERQRADADAGSGAPRRLSGALPVDRRTAHHRHRTDRDRQAQGRHDLSDAPLDRRNAIRRRALLHRFRARPDRAPANPGAAAGIAIRTGSHLAPERDGRDGVGARARAQSAARRHQQLHEGLAPAAGGQHRSQCAEDRKCHGPRRRTGASRRPDHPPAARFRLARRIRKARRKPLETDRGGRRARPGRRPRAEHPAALHT